MPRPRRHGTRVGTILVLAGAAGVLGVTFGAGVYLGRGWAPRPAPAGDADAPRADKSRPDIPRLTFYQELTAPLTAPPPPPKPGKPPKPLELARPAPHGDGGADGREPPVAGTAALASGDARGREADLPARAAPIYSIQVGAYRAREPAEALRATLVAAGHDAHVVESAAAGGARYRVRVGAYRTREAARDAAARLTDERALATFVTVQ